MFVGPVCACMCKLKENNKGAKYVDRHIFMCSETEEGAGPLKAHE